MTSNDMSHRINDALRRLNALPEAAETHGTLVGLYCARGRADRETWLAHIAPERDPADVLAQEALRSLTELYEETGRQLNDALLDFQPLLPGDEATLEQRTRALGEWCQGFLMGLSLGGVEQVETLPGDAAEVVRDLLDLARAGEFSLEGGEGDETAYAELVEYLRTGVLLINEELNPIKAPPRDKASLH